MYNYKKNMDKPVRIRLVHEYKEYYRLEFCTTNRRFFNTWYIVAEYERACIHYNLSGGWASRWFLVESKQDGNRKLAELRSRLKTVGDIYNEFIRGGEIAEAEDEQRYQEYMDKINAVPPVID
jgi:hypothetical protein